MTTKHRRFKDPSTSSLAGSKGRLGTDTHRASRSRDEAACLAMVYRRNGNDYAGPQSRDAACRMRNRSLFVLGIDANRNALAAANTHEMALAAR